jgi:hypothetical protein
MSAVTAGEGFPLGPGVLKIGATGTEIDISCNVNNAVIAANKNQGDNVTKLCGDVVPGAVTYDFTIGGNVDTDIGEATGFFALTQSAPGSQQDFTYTPNTDAGTTATGKCVIDPLDFGGGTTTETMTSDFEFAIVGDVAYTYGGGALADDQAADQAELVDA